MSPAAQAAIKETPDYKTATDVIAHKMAADPETGREAFGGIGSVAVGALVGGLLASPTGFGLGLLAVEE